MARVSGTEMEESPMPVDTSSIANGGDPSGAEGSSMSLEGPNNCLLSCRLLSRRL
jgi:hypothetical protein